MHKYILILIATMLLISGLPAHADENTDAIAACLAKYPDPAVPRDPTEPAYLRAKSSRHSQRASCYTQARINMGEAHRRELEDELTTARSDLDQYRVQIEQGQEVTAELLGQIGELLERIEALEGQLGQQVVSQTVPVSKPEVVQAPPQSQPSYGSELVVASSGVPYVRGVNPSLVSMYPIDGEREVARIHALDYDKSHGECGGLAGQNLLLITNHGMPMSVWAPQGASTGFVMVHVDMDGDGNPDGTYKAIDPRFHDAVYLTWRASDEIRFIYLRDSGQTLYIEGQRPQPMWEYPHDQAIKACTIGNSQRMDALEDYQEGGSTRLHNLSWPVR